MKCFLYWVLMLLPSIPPLAGFAQKEDRVWVVPHQMGIDFKDLTNPVSFSTHVSASEANASICNAEGVLQFYIRFSKSYIGPNDNPYDGKLINRWGEVLENGDSLYAQPSAMNGCLILPLKDLGRYILFSQGVVYFNNNNSSYNALFWHLVDMNYNAGKGIVLSKNNLLVDTINDNWGISERLCAIKQTNGKDYWLMGNSFWYGNHFSTYAIKASGAIEGPFYQTVPDTIGTWAGEVATTRSGDKIAIVSYFGGIFLLDFDRCTGRILKVQTLQKPYALTFEEANMLTPTNKEKIYSRYVGCAFSASGKRLYVGSLSNVYQYDLTAENIPATKTLLYDVFSPNGSFNEENHKFWVMELAPDDRIYLSKVASYWWNDNPNNSAFHLAVINKPNELGIACNFELNGFFVGESNRVYGGLPNMPNYHLGPLEGPYDMGLSWAASTVGTTATFENTTDCSTCSYLWHFGDGATSTAVSPTHTYADTGSYTVQLVATSIYGGCTDTLAQVLSIGTPTSTQSPVDAPSFSVYPNPTRERFTVALGAPTPCQLSLYNAVGRAVYRAQSTTPTHDIDVSTLPEGVYLLQVSTENRSFTKKITVRR